MAGSDLNASSAEAPAYAHINESDPSVENAVVAPYASMVNDDHDALLVWL